MKIKKLIKTKKNSLDDERGVLSSNSVKMVKKEETNDILQFLYPQLREVEISISQCKQDVTIKETGRERGDVWISKVNHNKKDFEKEIVCLIEAKHKKCLEEDKDWLDAMKQGKKKSLAKGLSFYIVTNTKDKVIFYNSYNNEKISLNSEIITNFQPISILQKLNSQINKDNSNLDTLKNHVKIPEKQFRKSLEKLDHLFRSCSISSAKEKIDTTISFMVIKYISDKEESDWCFKSSRKDKKIILWNDFSGNFENEFKNAKENFLSGKFGGNYKDFEKLISFSKKLDNENYELIWKELSPYYLHGADFDLFGVVYEVFATGKEKKDFGQFYTRRHITRSINNILLKDEFNYKPDLKICDPCCGTGGFLTEAFKVLKSNYEREGNLSKQNILHLSQNIFYGYDNDEGSVARTELNMFLVGDGHTNIKQKDTLKNFEEDGLEEEMYDYLISNPPYGPYKGSLKIENFSWSNEKRYEMLFLEKIVKACKRGGKMAIVIPDGVLEAPSREYFRKKLLENVDIDAIISLTKFAFAPYTKEKTYVLIMKRKQKENEGKIQTKGNVDAELVLHTMIEYRNYDKVIIVSGDGDFHCLIEYLEKKHKLLYIVIPNHKKYSALLRRFRKYFVYIDGLRKKLGKNTKRGSNLRTKP